MTGVWQDMMTFGIPLGEKVVRTILVYAFLVAGLRLFGKRELGQLNPLDFIVLLLLSNTVQNAIIGNDNSLIGGLAGAAVLFVVNEVLVRYSYRNPRIRRLIEGRAEELVKEGKVIRAALRHNMITHEELEAAARKQGIEHMSDVESCRLEVSGALSFTLKEPTEPERHHIEMMERLDAIDRRLAAIESRTA
jgi:uncharacterized membrane protein YcaP (DUF421 family)